MSDTTSLQNAKRAKQDEFYTQYADIQTEMNAYLEYNPDTFRGKTVLLPCDDPEWSNFTRYFAENFAALDLKKLISTSYAPDAKREKYGILFDYAAEMSGEKPKNERGKIFVLDHDVTGDGKVNFEDIEWKYLDGDGDFRSAEVKELRDEADVVVTNPPFSLFREYIAQLIKYNKKFLIVGHQNAIHYSEIFPLIRDNRVWLGYGFKGGAAHFISPYEDKANAGNHRENMIRVSGVCWFTNMEITKRKEELDLVCRYSPENYPTYANYDAIEVSKVSDIPFDYAGAMGVPTTFLDKFNPDQFEIIGLAEGDLGKELGLKPFDRELKKLNKSLRDGQVFYMKDGFPQKPYSRILIRNKHPKINE